MSRWDRITLVDRDIMKVLKKDKDLIGLKYYEIAKETGRNPKLIYYHMPKLEKLNFVERIEYNPALWILKPNVQNNISFVEVECPKCHGHQFAYLHQHTLTCKNEFCLTSKNRRTRFSITPKRIVGTPISLSNNENEDGEESLEDDGEISY